MGYGGEGSAGGLGKSMPGGQLDIAAGAAPTSGSGTAEQLKSPIQALNQRADKTEQAPTAAAAAQLSTNRNQGQAANQETQSAQVAESRQGAKQGQQAAAAAQNRQDVNSQRRNLQGETSGTAGLPRMERVLFVLQVMERKNAAENAPADAAGVSAPAAEAKQSKP